MFHRVYLWFKTSSTKWWVMTIAMLGIGALPCPECGSPMIFHYWPLAGLVVLVRYLKKHYQQETKAGVVQPPSHTACCDAAKEGVDRFEKE